MLLPEPVKIAAAQSLVLLIFLLQQFWLQMLVQPDSLIYILQMISAMHVCHFYSRSNTSTLLHVALCTDGDRSCFIKTLEPKLGNMSQL